MNQGGQGDAVALGIADLQAADILGAHVVYQVALVLIGDDALGHDHSEAIHYLLSDHPICS